MHPRGVLISGEQSGALRYYCGRPIVRWDLMTAGAFASAVDELAAARYDIWVALDDWEEPLFRQKFEGTPAGALDWPPRVDAGEEIRVRAWRLRDRAAFLHGTSTLTDRLR